MAEDPSNREPTRREGLERFTLRNEMRVRALHAHVGPDEKVVASGGHVLVTDQRIIFLELGLYQPRTAPNRESSDSLRFDEITRWALGHRHDGRPLLRLEHAPHVRQEWVPAHRFFRFRWGNATGPVTHRATTLPFNRARDPELLAIVDRLRVDAVPRGLDFQEILPGTRETRTAGSVAYLVAEKPRRRRRLK